MFQKIINNDPALAVEGDSASQNPRASVLASLSGAFQAGDANVRVGYFAWGADDGKAYSTLAAATAAGHPVLGFVNREGNTPSVVIAAINGQSEMKLYQGADVTLQSGGDFWINLAGLTPTAVIYADATTGAPTLTDNGGANPDSGFRGASTTKVNAVTNAATTIAVTTGIMTIAVVASGVFEAGQRVTGAGVPYGVKIVRQLTGGAGAAGTYQTDNIQRAAVAATTITAVQGDLGKISKAA